jgi:acyl transferase domain-containing protein
MRENAASRNRSALPANAIAIVGMAGRFSKSPDLKGYWRNLRAGRECISFFTPDELLAAGASPAAIRLPHFVPAGGVLEDADWFDATFFGFSAREAEILDPQQRVFLECSWHALEDAGYDPAQYPGAIGVYAGSSLSTYMFNLLANPDVLTGAGTLQVMLGNDKDHLATRIAYKLDLRGPAISVQTACSTSLVAVCLACQSLLDQHCDLALAGGVRIKFPQNSGYLYEEGMISSPDGHCRPFDARASGTLGGNGAGVVVLKRLEDAVTDGDSIRAVILGFALNNDGSSKVGYSAPSIEGQAAAIAAAQALAGIEPESISYIEAHGTATPLGDPIEMAALNRAFRMGTTRTQFCSIGSVKSNLGHLDAAAGIASLIKAVLMMNHREICPSLHFERPNPEIDFANSPFRVAAKLEPWLSNGVARRAGVSSFGMGGTNAHVVLEEWLEEPEAGNCGREPAPALLPLSAISASALEQRRNGLAAHLDEHPEACLSDIAWTLQAGRKRMPYRAYMVARTVEQAREGLRGTVPGLRTASAPMKAQAPNVILLFPGQGSQYPGMGRVLYRHQPVFRDAVDTCARLLKPHLGFDIRETIFEAPQDRLDETRIAQPALFLVSYALAEFWQSCGIKPAALMGHSVGEFVAGCVAGVMTLEDALFLVAERGRLMQETPRGCMLSVAAPEKAVFAIMREIAGHVRVQAAGTSPGANGGNAPDRELALAAVNAPGLCAVSGSFGAMDELQAELARRGIHFTRLHTSHAFHSPMTDPVLGPFAETARRVKFRPPRIPYISNATGDWVSARDATDPLCWMRHLRQTVRFSDGVKKLLETSDAVMLECGPGDVLCSLVRSHVAPGGSKPILPSIRRRLDPGEDDCSVILNAAGGLWMAGAKLDWRALDGGRTRRRVPLPLYPFERQRYWVDSPKTQPPVLTALINTGTALSSGAGREPFHNWFYKTEWSVAPPLASTIETPHKNFLIFAEPSPEIEEIVEQLPSAAASVVMVRRGSSFRQISDSDYEIRGADPADYHALLGELSASRRLPDCIVHAWNLPRSQTVAPVSIDEFESMQSAAFFSLVYLAQALGKRCSGCVLNVLASELQTLFPGDPVHPSRATLIGACRVLPQEVSGLRCRVIEVGGAVPAEEIAKEVQRRVLEPVVAFRGPSRFVPRFERVLPPAIEKGAMVVAQGRPWIITGGLGRIGLALAEALIRIAATPVVLVARSPVPSREDWPEILAEPDNDTARRIRGVEALEALGQPVEIAAADVSDESQVRTVVARARERFGDIEGVIHCAADTSSEAFVEVIKTDPGIAARHFRPKVRGLLNLEKALAEEQPGHAPSIVLMSSLAADLGGLGFCAYAAANAFLDAWADSRNASRSVPGASRCLSINWDGWNFGASDQQFGITPLEGMHAFFAVLGDEAAHKVSVATTDLPTRYRQWVRFEMPPARDTVQPAASSQHPRPELSSTYTAPRDEIEALLAGLWQEVFALDQIGVDDNFFELGGHSLLGIQLVSRIRDALGLDVSVRALLDSPTITSLRNKLAPELAELARQLATVEALSSEEARGLLRGNDGAAV